MRNRWLAIAALSGFFCIAFGAFAAHGLQKILAPQNLAWIDTGLKYQMFHTLALMGLGLFQLAKIGTDQPASCRAKAFHIIGGSWALGILCFSGSLYLLAFDFPRFLVWITPVGGMLFLIGWAALAYISLRKSN